MNRPFHIWSIFAICALVLLGAITWVTATAVRLERAQAEAQRAAQFEEKVRLALWRMDSFLAPLVVQESSWPYFAYSSFYPAERAYNRMFNEWQQGDVLVPSPLLSQSSSNVILHFQLGPDGKFTSPEVPNAPSEGKGVAFGPAMLAVNRSRLSELQTFLTPADLRAACAPITPANNDNVSWLTQTPAYSNSILLTTNAIASVNQQVQMPLQQRSQVVQNNMELQARALNYRQQLENSAGNNSKVTASPRSNVNASSMKPIWFGDALILARRVNVGGAEYVQGCWLDWASLQRTLLEAVDDVLPGARLEAVRTTPDDQQARLLAALPLKLIPAETRRYSSAEISPLVFALAAAWACMLLAAVAVGLLLHGTISLSERRGAFVSAVTHELRTPLTTFKMYSEMLADGMVPEEAKQKQYLATLCSEANRLSHLVENVLAYARLERGSARTRVERVNLRDLIERILPRLQERAERAQMKLNVDADESALDTVVHVDASAVEQILFNLVDNACKYAAPSSSEKLIHLEALPDGKFAMLRVRDHGEGIDAEAVKRLFKPFSKSAQEAAHTAPGIGLGLALCRRLSRSLGGDLRLVASVTRGACFELRLPLSARCGSAALDSI